MATDLAVCTALPEECSDGDAYGIAINVGGEIFSVAPCRLVQASPVFRDMFAINKNVALGSGEGTHSHPILIRDVETSAFRDFLWAIFVRPGELTRFLHGPKTAAKAVKLLHIAQVSHRFLDPGTLEWAMQQLHETLPAVNLGHALLVQLFAVLALFDAQSDETRNIVSNLRDALRQQLEYIDEHKPDPAEIPSHFIDPLALVRASTESRFTVIRADAYYHLLLLPHELWASPNSGLSTVDKQRMLSGAFLLGQEWSQLRGQMVPNSTYALSTLDAQVATKRPTDLLAMLKVFLDFLSCGVRSSRDGVLRRDVEERISTFTDRLPEYFDDRLFSAA